MVNALASRLDVTIKRDGNVYAMAFEGGEKVADLEVTGSCGKRNTGTLIRFQPDPQYFDSPNFSLPRLVHVLRAKAVLCPGLRVTLLDEKKGEKTEWFYEDGIADYLADATIDFPVIPEKPFTYHFEGETEAVDWAIQWLPEGGDVVAESYVNLIPTAQGAPMSADCAPACSTPCGNSASCATCCPGGQADRGRCLGSLLFYPVVKAPGPPIFRSNQGAAVVPGSGGVCIRCRQGRLQPVAEPAHPRGGAAGRAVY